MDRRAFSLVELLVVVAILAVLAALLFPVLARSKERAKLTDCGTRLHGFAAALNLYRADHDDRGFVWVSRVDGMNHYRAPFNNFEPMRPYLGDGSVLWCPEPNADPTEVSAWNFHAYPTFLVPRPDLPELRFHVPPRPVPGTVVAYCRNHTRADCDPRYDHWCLRIGTYPFVREDASLGTARSEAIVLGFDDFKGDAPERPYGMLRFPGEPWPPTPEE